MARVKLALAMVAASTVSVLMTACGSGGGTVITQQNFTLSIASANPASGVQIAMTTDGSSASVPETTPATVTGASGATYSLTAPNTAGANTFSSWSGCTSTTGAVCNVTLNANTTVTANYSAPAAVAPAVTLTVPSTIVSGAAFTATVTVAGPSGAATPTGSITLSSGTFSYSAGALTNGSLTINVPAGSWNVAAGAYTLTAAYTPDSDSSATYTAASGTASVTVTAVTATTYTVTIDSTNPASGVTITASPADDNSETSAATPGSLTYNAGTAVTLTAPATAGSNTFGSWTGCTSSTGATCNIALSANTTVTANYTTPVSLIAPTVTVNPSSSTITTEQSLPVTITVAAPTGDAAPTGSVSVSNGSGYTSSGVSLNAGSSNSSSVTVTIPAGKLTPGSNTLTATYTPGSASSATYTTATGSQTVTENKIAPAVSISPNPSTIGASESSTVTVTVAAPSGDPTPTGSVQLTSGSYTSSSAALSGGSATISVQGSSLASGSNTLTATYTPDSASSPIYSIASSSSGTITVGAVTTVSVDQSSAGPTVTDKILGVNLESWYDVVANASTVVGPMQTAGIQSLRWPGGSWSDVYHWNNGGTPYQCTCASATSCTANSQAWAGNSDEAFGSFETAIAKAGAGFDLALTADYGTNETCNGGGDPNEAAAWAAAAVTNGYPASHITVGNEEYGDWETDLHASAHNATTYADSVIGTNGYYDSIKNAITNAGGNPNDTLVGVVVDANCGQSSGCTPGWDNTVLTTAKGYYDFVEYHYYPEYQNGYDSSLIGSDVQNFTSNIKIIRNELTAAGEPNTPIYVGEISSNSANGGTQNWSITQGLYAGEILGEAMNDGISRLTWWDGFGNCAGNTSLPPNNSSLYGWQDWGAQNIFSAGPSTDSNCPGDGPAGTLSPTAIAFQLFSNVAVSGETALTATVSGDTTDVRAYSATHSGGTALVLFNLNPTTAEPVQITLSSATTTTDLKVLTYDKEIYDYTNPNCQADSISTFTPYPCTYDPTHNYSTQPDWAGYTTTDMGAQTLPVTLTLQPWSMNVVLIK